ncbi:CDP-alcohol phosphatidyltransferase family protein [Streptomyces hygroscopicus subsp. hygroscopicus]|uniref:CDP-alcohol phosphatidyltransferase family protein n=1 Tax=Streptomyces hygroscopicus TaxID=1912 RepID=UPI001C65B25D|nr:CDP-alcohol phosphatidyltransferase family protein [Streptomyces hygroscopicus]MBW8090146.1 CDP-alcohol phosphatidyltransferase family protein [Streptomyces hygroscopicus subsp. hygroscopicus]
MPRDIPPLAEVRRITEKKRDAWWTVMLVDPVATPLVRWIAKYTRATPNQLTWGAFLVGLGSAACFAQGDWRWLLLGAVLYHVSFIFDCMDGKLARLTGTGSVFGAWLDFVFDRIRVLVCSVALMGGQYARTDDVLYLWLALAVASLDALRYIDSLEIFKIRHGMRKQIKARMRAARKAENQAELAFMEDLLRENPEADLETDRDTVAPLEPVAPLEAAPAASAMEATPATSVTPAASSLETASAAPATSAAPALSATSALDGASAPGTAAATGAATDVPAPASAPARRRTAVVDLHQEFRRRFPWWVRCRNFLLRHRIRAHLISGIEFQMGVFIIGPAVDAVVATTVVSGVLLLIFELAIIYKLLLSTRDFTRTINSFETAAAPVNS